MGTQDYVGLYFEYDCGKCNGTGSIYVVEGGVEPIYSSKPKLTSQTRTKEICDRCNGTGKLWRRWHYTHAVTYEEALDKLLPRLSQWGSFPDDGKWLLVWKRRGKIFLVTDVTPAVKYRINKIMVNRRRKLLKTSVKLR